MAIGRQNKIEIVITARDDASSTISGVGDNFAAMGKKIATAAAGIAAALGLIKLTRAVARYGSEATLSAARSSELAAVLDLLGNRADWSADQIDANVDAMMDLGIRSDVARGLLAQFARYQLDAADATSIARVAQDAAVLSMKDSSDALDQIMHGILTQNSLVLRNAGLNIMASKAMETYADELGKTAKQLTETERIQAMMNAVMEEGTRIAGAYETAMEEPGKRLRSLRRHFYEVQNAIGSAFLPAFGNMIGMVENYVKWIRTAVEEGGFLYPALMRLGAGADILSGHLAGLASRAMEAGQSVYEQFGGRVQATANAALQWGINISTQLASGIIQGAAAALTAAMNYVSSILSWFLSPGSPPRVAPHIDEWGRAAMTEYLRGFTTASFDILEGIQRPLENVLTTLVSAGELGQAEAAQIFLAIGRDLTLAADEFQQTGRVTASLFDRLREVGGEFGDQLVELAQRQLAVTAAADRMREATQRLTRAQSQQERSQDDLARITDEYNLMLLEGASYEELAAKRAEKAAAERAAAHADAAVDAAEIEQDAAREQMELERERLDLQGRLISQLELLARTQAQAMEEAALGGGGGAGAGGRAPAGGGGGAALPELDLPEMPAGGGITRGINEAFEEARKQVAATWARLFAPVREAWEQDIQPALDKLSTAWDTFKATLSGFWKAVGGPQLVENIKGLIPPELLENIGWAVGVVGTFKLALLALSGVAAVVAAVIGAINWPILALIVGIGLLKTAWEADWGDIQAKTDQAWTAIKLVFDNIRKWITDKLIPKLTDLYDKWTQEVWPTIQTVTENVWAIIKAIFVEIGRWINDNLGPWVEYFGDLWSETVWPAIQTALEDAWDFIEGVWVLLLEWLEVTLPGGIEGLQEVWEPVMDALETAVQSVITIWDTLVVAVKGFWTWITGKEFKIKIKIPDLPSWALPDSPLPIHTAWQDFSDALRGMTFDPSLAFARPLPALAGAAVGGGETTSTSHLYIERVVIENAEDAPDLLRQLQEIAI